MLDYLDYSKEYEVIVRQNPLYCVMTDKSSFVKQRKTEDYTIEDIDNNSNDFVKADVTFNDGTYFSAGLEDALNSADRDIAQDFIDLGYTYVGGYSHNIYITATGKHFDHYRDGQPKDCMSHNEIARGKLYGAFLKSLQQNKLKEFLARPELLTKTNSSLMLNADFKVKLVEAIKFVNQETLVTIDEKMVAAGKTQQEIDDKCKSVVADTKKNIKLLESYFEKAQLKVSAVGRKSNVEKFQEEINNL